MHQLATTNLIVKLHLFFIKLRRPHRSTLFPYTTLFRSRVLGVPAVHTLHGLHFERQVRRARDRAVALRSEEHTSELQSPDHLVCRLLLEKKNRRLLSALRLTLASTSTSACVRIQCCAWT